MVQLDGASISTGLHHKHDFYFEVSEGRRKGARAGLLALRDKGLVGVVGLGPPPPPPPAARVLCAP
jgi:hypothetical protein